MRKMLQTRHMLSEQTEANWQDEKMMSFNKFGELSEAGAKLLRTIDRDRYEIRFVVKEKTRG